MFSKGVKIFQKVECLFKPRLIADWESEPVGVATVLDDKNPSARFVTVPLNQRVGKAILCRFYFADTWMMMSEISFQSGEYSFSQADLVKDREQKRWCGGAGRGVNMSAGCCGATWWGGGGGSRSTEKGWKGNEGAERSSLRWMLFRLILMHMCRSTTRATKNWTIERFFFLRQLPAGYRVDFYFSLPSILLWII